MRRRGAGADPYRGSLACGPADAPGASALRTLIGETRQALFSGLEIQPASAAIPQRKSTLRPPPRGNCCRGVNTNRWNRIRYTLWAPLYDKVVLANRSVAVLARRRARSAELAGSPGGERVQIVHGCRYRGGSSVRYLPRGGAFTATPSAVWIRTPRARAAALGMNVDARVRDVDAPDAKVS